MQLYDLPAHILSEKLNKKEISSVELLDVFLNRIDSLECDIHAYITLTPDLARRQAEKVDAARMNGEDLPKLAGIPYALKDNICTEGIRTTAASKMLEDFFPPYSATVAHRLKNSGGILLGKLNEDEFSMGNSTDTSAFFKTKNPHDLSKVPGGSSGGSAAAVAAGEAAYTIGSDTGGSIRQPASFCGVCGLKPSYGRISRHGLIAFASSLDQMGPMSKDVEDLALVYQAIAGYDPMDATTSKKTVEDCVSSKNFGVKGMRIAVAKEYYENASADVLNAMQEVIKALVDGGAVVEECSMPNSKYALAAYKVISSIEALSNLGRFDGIRFGKRSDNGDSIEEIIAHSRGENLGYEVKKRLFMAAYLQDNEAVLGYVKSAQKLRTMLIKEFNETFLQYELILTPTSCKTAHSFNVTKESDSSKNGGDRNTAAANLAALPALSLPVGFDRNAMPIGAQFIAPMFDEFSLFRAAFFVEAALNHVGA